MRSPARPAHAAHRWLGPVAVATGDLAPYLEDWHEALGPLTPPPHHVAATGHLIALLLDSPLRPDVPETLDEIVPPEAGTAAGQLRDWLVGPGIAHQLRRAAIELAGTRDERRVALAAERLGRFASAVGQERPPQA